MGLSHTNYYDTIAINIVQEAIRSKAREVTLAALSLDSLPKNIAELTECEFLDLSLIGLKRLPRTIAMLPKLKHLNLHRNAFDEWPDVVFELSRLERLQISENHLTGLPDQIGRLVQLTDLSIPSNQIARLPESLGQLANLAKLNISHNKLEKLPESIGGLNALEGLFVSNNQLTELPESIGRLHQLRTLDASKNGLGELPASLGRLSRLRTLRLAHNKLVHLPEAIGDLSELKTLDLSHNPMSSLPASMARLQDLVDLDLSGTGLAQFPQELGKLGSLGTLNLSGNQLAEFPLPAGGAPQLRELDLRANQLTELPDSIGGLSELTYLDLTGNKLTALPKSLRQLTKLKWIFLHDNPELGLPPEVLGPRRENVSLRTEPDIASSHILDYVFRTQEEGRPLNEAKLILVGRGGVGKTSLVERLVHDRFDAKQPKTDGIRITEWPVGLSTGESVKLHVWDFGGQEIMHATHQFFLTERSLYLLVLSGREGTEDYDADYWLRLIESFGANSPVIVVLNKVAEMPFDVNRRALQVKYPSVRAVVQTDCKEGVGLRDLYGTILRETDQLENLRATFPASWFAIKERLPSSRKNFLTYSEYQAFCGANGETDPSAQESLAEHLHRLGIALNFKDDARLRDTHVLNPHWVTTGVYHVLNSAVVKENGGVLRLTDLERLLDRDEYPREMHRFLIDLMKKFELCFSYPDDELRYLLPELVDKQEPDVAGQFDAAHCLNFQYHYTVIPEGLIPRFIVRTHSLSEGLPRWRTGAVLRFEGCDALVKADVPEKKVYISVKGPTAGSRRNLLAVIRSDFERIHADIPRLQPLEMVPIPGQPSTVLPYEKLRGFEESGITTMPEFVAGKVISVDVRELLNGIDFKKAGNEMGAVRLFYSYSHKDEEFRNQLETHLKLLQRQGVIAPWHDRMIGAGEEWAREISQYLEGSDIVLLLISADFIASDYCYDNEMTRAIARHEAGEAVVIPIILRDVDWASAPFGRLQALPRDGKPISLWTDRDSAWRDVAAGIRRTAEGIRHKRS